MFGQEDLHELLAFDAGDAKVVSLYMNTDTVQTTRDTIKLQARGLLREVQEEQPQDATVIENYFDMVHDWSKSGLALFSCAERDFFRAYPTAVAFRNRIRLGHKPYVKPLAHLLDHYAHYGVILVDRIGARFFEFHLGELQATGGTMGEDVRKVKHGGGSTSTGTRGGPGGSRSEEEAAQRNLRETAAAANDFFARKDIRRLFLGGTAETVGQFRHLLPKRLLSCLAGTFTIEMTAPEHEVRARTLALLQEANAEREKRLVEKLITLAAKDGQAVVGLNETLQAVSDGRVQTLILCDGFRVPGYRHESTGFLVADERQSKQLGEAPLAPLEDVVEAAVSRTMEQGGHVEVISDNMELERAGRIGALLRY
jgi:peptide chain release factor subunit 1